MDRRLLVILFRKGTPCQVALAFLMLPRQLGSVREVRNEGSRADVTLGERGSWRRHAVAPGD